MRDDRIHVDVVLDERSGGFRALGAGLGTGHPAIVCCTSGTAAANLHPAVVEAHHARVPMVVCTADRPAELRDAGAGQTIDQTRLFGDAVRWFHDPGPPEATIEGADPNAALARAGVPGGRPGLRAGRGPGPSQLAVPRAPRPDRPTAPRRGRAPRRRTLDA